ncbi:unnamed protein product, partial [Meganyctiphanes norvegica]
MAGCSGVETNRLVQFLKLDRCQLKEWFVAGACIECHTIPSEDVSMKTCSNCCLVWYCGKECQKNNWKYHKDFCKATSSAAAIFESTYIYDNAYGFIKETGKDFEDYYLVAMIKAVTTKLNREFDDLEIQILWNPKVCEICKDSDPVALKPCKICYRVYYCSKKHAKRDSLVHRKLCPEFLLSLQCYNLIATKGIPIPSAKPFRIPTVSEYKPMSGTMKDYVKTTFDPVNAFLSEYISYTLSLLYALEHTGLNGGTKKVSEVKELTILMSDPCEGTHGTMLHNATWENMFHLLPKLKKLNLILCEGPIEYQSNKPIDGVYGDLCSNCISKKCKFDIYMINDFHKFKLSKGYKKPDVIYNHEVIDLPYPDPEVPLVLLGTHGKRGGIEESLELMRENENVGILLPIQSNPFRGMLPKKVPNYKFVKEDSSLQIQYTNGYIVAVKRQPK